MIQPSELDHFAIILEFAAGIADRGIPLSLVLVEPDGDPEAAFLDRFAEQAATRIRRSDRFARLTDRRFAALLVDCNRQGAMIFADRVQSLPKAESPGITLPCGIAWSAEPRKAHGGLMGAGEGALDRARSAGGGAIELHRP